MTNDSLGHARPLDERTCTLGEGPVWVADTDTLWWVDILNRTAHWRRDRSGETGSVTFPSHPGALLPVADGSWLAFLVNTIEHYDATFSRSQTVTAWPHQANQPDGDPLWRANDAAVGPHGEVICGTMPYAPDAHPGTAFVYQLVGEELVKVADGITISNGIGWTSDGTRMLYVDSPTCRIDIFDVGPDNMPENRRLFADTDPAWGLPDGLSVDSDDNVWVAFWGGSRVQRFDPSGQPSGFIQLPCEQVTSCAFFGPELNRLAITTSALGQEDNEAAGLTYVFDTDVAGQPSSKAIR
jgi:sugar lactone lactonase YvrE